MVKNMIRVSASDLRLTVKLATLMEEFRDVADKVIQYCKDKKYISEGISYDVDSIADGIVKEQDPL
jgi:hypothetical protein